VNLPIQRSPFRLENRAAYKELKALIDYHQYELIHCHTPMGGVLARLAARKARQSGTKVLYTAHGFHFCKGAPLISWLLYYPVEKWLSRWTDSLITINKEDFSLATQRGFRAQRIEHVRGVGVDTEIYKPATEVFKSYLREQHGFNPREILFFYAAEFNANKNHILLIRALAEVQAELPQAKLLLAGDGALLEESRALAASLGMEHKVVFMGYRKDVQWILRMCDVAVASSLREGLPVNILEAMASGLPIVATYNRGHSELIEDSVNGFLVPAGDVGLYAQRLLDLGSSVLLRRRMGLANVHRVQPYAVPQIESSLSRIYKQYMQEEANHAESQYRGAYI
jgi:glycosyltransferase EpsD